MKLEEIYTLLFLCIFHTPCWFLQVASEKPLKNTGGLWNNLRVSKWLVELFFKIQQKVLKTCRYKMLHGVLHCCRTADYRWATRHEQMWTCIYICTDTFMWLSINVMCIHQSDQDTNVNRHQVHLKFNCTLCLCSLSGYVHHYHVEQITFIFTWR